MTAPVAILGCGMMTGVGLTAEASCAAIRARLDRFKETHFISGGGDWIVGTEVPLEQALRGIPRLAHLLAGSIRECLALVPEVAPDSMPVLLCVAEDDRPGRPDGLGTPLFLRTCALLDVHFHPRSRVVAQGRVGGVVALHHASRMIHKESFRHVIVAAADSYLLAATLQAYEQRGRILTGENTNGFIPGEAGGAFVVTPLSADSPLACLGMGFANEQASIESEEPLRADGLTRAISDALADAGLAMHEIDYRLTDVSGEQYAFKEASLALSRTLRQRKEEFDIWHPADCVGEVGAAALPCMLAVGLAAARKGYAPGPNVLLHLANDDGRRVALVVRSQESG